MIHWEHWRKKRIRSISIFGLVFGSFTMTIHMMSPKSCFMSVLSVGFCSRDDAYSRDINNSIQWFLFERFDITVKKWLLQRGAYLINYDKPCVHLVMFDSLTIFNSAIIFYVYFQDNSFENSARVANAWLHI